MIESVNASGGTHWPRVHLYLGGQSLSVLQAATARGDEKTIIIRASIMPIVRLNWNRFNLIM